MSIPQRGESEAMLLSSSKLPSKPEDYPLWIRLQRVSCFSWLLQNSSNVPSGCVSILVWFATWSKGRWFQPAKSRILRLYLGKRLAISNHIYQVKSC